MMRPEQTEAIAQALQEEYDAAFPFVEVLLATYNGATYLEEQIRSILGQTGVRVSILARDDGSYDETLHLLHQFQRQVPDRFTVLDNKGERCGAKGNFIRLLEASSAKYVALSDQDDVWLPEKLSLEVRALQEAEQSHPGSPVLVFTDLIVVRQDLSVMQASFWHMQKIPAGRTGDFGRLLVQNTFTGCTGLMNRELVDLCSPMPDLVFMHDWWILLIAACYGKLVPLPVQTVLYRQHGGNVVGAPEKKNAPRYGLIPKFRQHSERRRLWEVTLRNAQALLQRFGESLPDDKRRVLEGCLQCEYNASPLIRAVTMIRFHLFYSRLRLNLATLWYLLDMNAAKRAQP